MSTAATAGVPQNIGEGRRAASSGIAVFKQALCALAGFALGTTSLFGALPSLAVAFCAAVPSRYILSAAAGAMAGFAITADAVGGALTGIACIAAAAAVNRAATTLLRPSESGIAAFFAAFLCCAATGATIQIADVFSLNSTVYYFCEGILAGGAAYFYSRSSRLFPFFKSAGSLSAAEITCLSISLCSFLLCGAHLAFGLIVPVRAAAVLLILTLSIAAGESGGSISGICAGVCLQLACGIPGLAGAFALAGLLSGLFAVLGQTVSALVYMAVTGLFCVLSATPESVAVLTETAVACIIFIAVPRRFIRVLKQRFTCSPALSPTDNSGSDVSLSLKAASNALKSVATSVRNVNRAHGQSDGGAVGEFVIASDILSDLAGEMDDGSAFLLGSASRAAEAMRTFGISVTDISCRKNKNGRISVTALADTYDRAVNKSQLAAYVGRACGCSMCIPSIRENGENFILSFSQTARHRARVGACQSASGQNEYCGDCYELFCDGRGRQLMVLSDGMGTGGNAAVDASMTAGLFSLLLGAGVGFECALRIVNSALLSKRTDDESLATLDVTCIDLYTGRTDFYKAGGAATFVRKNGKAAVLELSALPAGIIKDISFERARAQLSRGDIVVMTSDGVTDNGNAWLLDELKYYNGEDAQELSEILLRRAMKNHGDERCDDITVMCAIIE